MLERSGGFKGIDEYHKAHGSHYRYDKHVSLGSTMGGGARTFLYEKVGKKKPEVSPETNLNKSKIDFRQN